MKKFVAMMMVAVMMLTTAAFAESTNFTPSVSGKPAPVIVPSKGETSGETSEGGEYIAVIRHPEEREHENVYIPDGGHVVITAVVERHEVEDEQIKERLDTGYNVILDALHVGELIAADPDAVQIPDGETDAETVPGAEPTEAPVVLLAEQLDQRLIELEHEHLDHQDLIVKELFDVAVYGDYLVELDDEENKLEITVAPDINVDEMFITLYSEDGLTWELLPIEDVIVNEPVNEDDVKTLTLRMRGVGLIAFLVEFDEEIHLEDAVLSPN